MTSLVSAEEMNRPYFDIAELPRELPVFPLAGCLLLPRSELPLNIFEPRYLAMVDAALAGARLIAIVQPLPESAAETSPMLYPVGCAGKIVRFAETGDGRYFISLEGVCRFRSRTETTRDTPYRTFDVSYADFPRDLVSPTQAEQADRNAVLRALGAYAERNSIAVDWDAVAKASDESLINSLSMMSPFGIREKQALLEAGSLHARAEVLIAIAEMDLAGGQRRPPLH